MGIVCLTACGKETAELPPETMYIEQADIPDLGKDIWRYENTGTWRYAIDDSIRSIAVKKYNLENGKWYDFGGSRSYGDALGKNSGIGIGYDNLRVATAIAIGRGGGRYSEKVETYQTSLHSHEVWLEGWKAIEDGKEIPLTMQIMDEDEVIALPSLDLFYEPEKLAEMGFQSVAVATVTFSSEISE